MDEHQDENRPYSFRFEMKPAKKLVQAIKALCDSKLNPQGLGRIDVDDKNFEITVRNDNVIAFLLLKSSGLINFSCRNPIKNKMVNLNYILEELVRAADDDIVSIYLVDGSKELHYMFESSSMEFCVEVFEGMAGFGKCPVIHFDHEAIILTRDFREMIPFMVKEEIPQTVSLKLTKKYAKIVIGEQDWGYRYDKTKTGGTRGVPPGEKFKGGFSTKYTDSLWKASFVAAGFLLSRAHNLGSVMLRFNLRELGDLAYIIGSFPANSAQQQGSETRIGFEGDFTVCETSKESHFFDSFSFELKPAYKLKVAIAALCDSDFNPQGFGRIDVDQNGLYIIFRNTESKVTCNLNLNASGLINFKFCKPIVGKMIQLTKILVNLMAAADEGTVTIYHLDGSGELSFMFGDSPLRRFSVELLEMNNVIEKLPQNQLTLFCETGLPLNHLWQMISELVQEEAQIVLRLPGQERRILLKSDFGERTGGNKGMTPGDRHHAWFCWPHVETLKMACVLNIGVVLGFVANPRNSVMLCFSLEELGDLVYIREAVLIVLYASEIGRALTVQ